MISSYYPFIVEKGQALRLFLHFNIGASATPGQSDITSATITTVISKDGSAFVATTNSVVKIDKDEGLGLATRGCAYIDLTASEMNADNIFFSCNISGATANTEPPTFVIKTGKLTKVMETLDRRLKKGKQKL